MEFCGSPCQDSSKGAHGLIIPVVISVFNDKSFTFITKTPPAFDPAEARRSIAKGSGSPE